MINKSEGGETMNEYLAMASVYDDLLTTAVLEKIRFYDARHCTSIHKLTCKSIEEAPDLSLDKYGEEYDRLRGHVYLYTQIDGIWKRITD